MIYELGNYQLIIVYLRKCNFADPRTAISRFSQDMGKIVFIDTIDTLVVPVFVVNIKNVTFFQNIYQKIAVQSCRN